MDIQKIYQIWIESKNQYPLTSAGLRLITVAGIWI